MTQNTTDKSDTPRQTSTVAAEVARLRTTPARTPTSSATNQPQAAVTELSRQVVSRREALWTIGGGLGGVALASLLDADRLLAAPAVLEPLAKGGPLPHHSPKARRIVQLFLNGGMSQMDTFDYKPELEHRHGEKFDPGEKVEF